MVQKDQFLSWQCRIRQIYMREQEGRPGPGMSPRVETVAGEQLAEQIVTLIIKLDPFESTDFFKFQVQRSHDPQEVFKKGLQYLQSTYFHKSREFSDQLTAQFKEGSSFASQLLEMGRCTLVFEDYGQTYRLICDVDLLEGESPFREATLWHNRLFNPNISDDVIVLLFTPDWLASEEAQ